LSSVTNVATLLNAGWKAFQKASKEHGVGLLGFKNGTFAIPRSPITSMTTVAHMVFMDPATLRANRVDYDRSLRAFEDIDMLFQCVQKGLGVLRLNHWVYYTTPSGTHEKGGIDYRGGIKETYLNKIVAKYPLWIVNEKRVRASDGQPEYRIAWDKLEAKLDTKKI
jgi:hypothetical protein